MKSNDPPKDDDHSKSDASTSKSAISPKSPPKRPKPRRKATAISEEVKSAAENESPPSEEGGEETTPSSYNLRQRDGTKKKKYTDPDWAAEQIDEEISSTTDSDSDGTLFDIDKPVRRRKDRKKRSNDPVHRLCKDIISTRLAKDAEGFSKKPPMITCRVCEKDISLRAKNGPIAYSKAKTHAMTHLKSPDQLFYRCRLCDVKKSTWTRIRMHLFVNHRGEAIDPDGRDNLIDESDLEENRQAIMNIITKCFADPTPAEGTDRNPGQSSRMDAATSRQEVATAVASVGAETEVGDETEDAVVEYCLRLRREKESGGYMKCMLCKKMLSVNVYSNETVVSRMKQHAFVHSGKHFYKCQECQFGASTYNLLAQHVKRSHGQSMSNAKFDDFSSSSQYQADILQALRRSFEQPTIVVEPVVEQPSGFIYLMPNGDLVVPAGSVNGREDILSNIDAGSIVTLETEEVEEVEVFVQ